MADGMSFPAQLASEGRCELLVDSDAIAFTEQNHTINLRIEVLLSFSSFKVSIIHPVYVPTVAGLRWVGSSREHRVS
jgi:hypothetical protein